jgi:hypothetical protein
MQLAGSSLAGIILSSVLLAFSLMWAMKQHGTVKTSLIAVSVSIVYALLYAFLTGMIVTDLTGSIPQTFETDTPAVRIVTCCGSPGMMPVYVAYLTPHIAVTLVPLTLFLLVTFAALLIVNIDILLEMTPLRRSRYFGGLGAVFSIFAACPSCAGVFFLSVIGSAGSAFVASSLADFQVVFAAVTLPLMLYGPVYHRFKHPECRVESEPPRAI